MTTLPNVPSMIGKVKSHMLWTATQTQPLASTGASNGSRTCRKVANLVAPLVQGGFLQFGVDLDKRRVDDPCGEEPGQERLHWVTQPTREARRIVKLAAETSTSTVLSVAVTILGLFTSY
jgi:hypothetical protein